MFKLYLYGALALAAITSVGIIYAKGRLDASNKAQITRLTDERDTARLSLEKYREAYSKDQGIKEAQDTIRVRLVDKITELRNVENGEHECLTSADVGRLLSLWNNDAD